MRRIWALIAAVSMLLLISFSTSAEPVRPTLQDAHGLLSFNCGFDAGASAPKVCAWGRAIGVYIDDEQPNKEHWIYMAQKEGYSLILVARAPNESGCPWQGVTCLQEKYPFGCRPHPWSLPDAQGYILQYHFAWPRCRAPTRSEILSLLIAALKKRPVFLLFY